MCFSGGGGGDGGASAAAAQEATRQANISQGQDSIDKAFSGFDQSFYDKQSQAYKDFAQPQVDRQWGDAQDQLNFALDRAGIEHSSVAGKAQADAQYQHDQAEQSISDTAAQTAAGTMGKVAAAKASLSGQLNSDANASEAAGNASNQSALLGLQPAFSPVGNLFQNLTGNLSSYAQGTGLIPGLGYGGATGASLYSSNSGVVAK